MLRPSKTIKNSTMLVIIDKRLKFSLNLITLVPSYSSIDHKHHINYSLLIPTCTYDNHIYSGLFKIWKSLGKNINCTQQHKLANRLKASVRLKSCNLNGTYYIFRIKLLQNLHMICDLLIKQGEITHTTTPSLIQWWSKIKRTYCTQCPFLSFRSNREPSFPLHEW